MVLRGELEEDLRVMTIRSVEIMRKKMGLKRNADKNKMIGLRREKG